MIAIDWGTTSLRAYLLDAAGQIIDQCRAALGILACQGRFEAVLADQIAGWDDPVIVLAGMIGSRQGWRDVPYIRCAAGPAEIAGGMEAVQAESLPGRQIWIVPGLSHEGADGVPEVMRGEETQICGLLEQLGDGRHILCLPGTHNKWVVIEDGRIVEFFTAMTGEVFSVLRQHSILGKLMEGDAHDAEAFSRGIAQAARPGGLLHHLFGVRTTALFGSLGPTQLASYLSGLLIGHETLGLAPNSGLVHMVGGERLTELYAVALQARGVSTQAHGEASVARGIYLLAQARGLIA